MGTVGIYVPYINKKYVVLASEPVGGRSRVTELPCFLIVNKFKLEIPQGWGGGGGGWGVGGFIGPNV